MIFTVAEMTGKNFIVDPRIKGKVTVISARPMNADEIYQVFLSVLNVNGYAAIPGKNAIKIVPEVDAKQDAVRTTSDENPGRGDEYVTRVIQLHNIAATQLVPVVRALLPQEAHLAAYPDTNVLVVSASAEGGVVGRADRLIDDEVISGRYRRVRKYEWIGRSGQRSEQAFRSRSRRRDERRRIDPEEQNE